MADGARAALVVAAHEFVDPKFQRLRSPAEDVNALAAVLEDPAIGGFEVRTVVNESNGTVQQELERFFSNRKPDDLLLLYFSCHGVKDPSGRLHFVTSNTTFDLLRSTGVSATFVGEQMEFSRSKRIVVFLDCCYSGAFTKGFRARGDDAVPVDQLEGRGRAVITASRATEYAFEADELTSENAQPSLFTGAIVDGLSSGRADQDGDGIVTVDELYDFVYEEVRGKVAGQTPGRWVDVEGDLVVARNPYPPVRLATLPPELERAIESDLALQRLGAVTELSAWHRGDDPARQAAATLALTLLTEDHDQRVRAAARVVLGQPEPGLPTPDVTEPASTDARPTGVSMPASLVGDVASRSGRAAGWMAVLGGLSVVLASSFPFLRYADYSDSLGDREWFTEGSLVLLALTGSACYLLVRAPVGWRTGLLVLAAAVPFAVGSLVTDVAQLVHGDVQHPEAGWLLHVVGLGLISTAGATSVASLKGQPALDPGTGLATGAPSPRGVRTVVALAGLTVGAVAALGWARLYNVDGDSWLGVSTAARDLAVRLALVAGIATVGRRRLQSRGVRPRMILTAAFGLGALAVIAFLTSEYVLGGDFWLYVVAFVVLAAGAVAVAAIATALVPPRSGAVLVGSWVLSSATWVPSSLAGSQPAAVLGWALVGGAALSGALLALHLRSGSEQSGRLRGAGHGERMR